MKKNINNEVILAHKFRYRGKDCTGNKKGARWYAKGIATAQKSMRYSSMDFEHFYDTREHCDEYLQKEENLFWKAIDCYKIAAQNGNDLAMVNYALYLFYYGKEKKAQALDLFLKASEAGQATADYALYCIFKNGYNIVEPNIEKAKAFFAQFEQRCRNSERQRILVGGMDRDGTMISISYFHAWSCGYTFNGVYDVPGYCPHSWL